MRFIVDSLDEITAFMVTIIVLIAICLGHDGYLESILTVSIGWIFGSRYKTIKNKREDNNGATTKRVE